MTIIDESYLKGYEAGMQRADVQIHQLYMTLAGIADVINQELRENGGDRFQTDSSQDMRLAIRALVDCCRRRSEMTTSRTHSC